MSQVNEFIEKYFCDTVKYKTEDEDRLFFKDYTGGQILCLLPARLLYGRRIYGNKGSFKAAFKRGYSQKV